jgi:hypothetical protein
MEHSIQDHIYCVKNILCCLSNYSNLYIYSIPYVVESRNHIWDKVRLTNRLLIYIIQYVIYDRIGR